MNVSAPPLERIAAAYGVSTVTLRDWKRRGVTNADLLDPVAVAAKLRATAKHDSPRLRLLQDNTTVGHIAFRLALIQ